MIDWLIKIYKTLIKIIIIAYIKQGEKKSYSNIIDFYFAKQQQNKKHLLFLSMIMTTTSWYLKRSFFSPNILQQYHQHQQPKKQALIFLSFFFFFNFSHSKHKFKITNCKWIYGCVRKANQLLVRDREWEKHIGFLVIQICLASQGNKKMNSLSHKGEIFVMVVIHKKFYILIQWKMMSIWWYCVYVCLCFHYFNDDDYCWYGCCCCHYFFLLLLQ